MSEWTSTAGLTWRALHPFGVEIDHEFFRPLSAVQAKCFVDLLWRSGLVLARGQRLTMEQQRDLCALTGPILMQRAGEDGYISTVPNVEASFSELRWHSDAAYTDAPFDALSLHAVDVVDDASSTCFISAAEVLDSMPAALRERLEGAQVEMISPSYEAIGLRACDQRDPVAQKRGILPAIFDNPHNGRACIRVSEMQTARILGMEWEASRDLLNAVYDHAYLPAHVFEHRWRNGDLVVWDNIALQHMRGSLKHCGTRVLQRVIVGTDVAAPPAHPAN